MLKVKLLIENKTYKGEYFGEHGLSLYIETDEKKILFDFGLTDAFIKNAVQMGIDLKQVDFAVVSHGHGDHTGGVPDFCGINSHAPVYIHKNAFKKPYPMENGKLSEKHCGIQWADEQRDKLRERLSLTDGVTWITDDIVISGSIPPAEGFKPTAQFFLKDKKSGLVQDEMEHEQFLAIRDKPTGGVYVFSGCSHTGVVACLKYAQELFRGEPIKALLAGMHLYGADAGVRKQALDEILAFDIPLYLPVHCTGMEAICDLKARLCDRCVILNTGGSYQWGS